MNDSKCALDAQRKEFIGSINRATDLENQCKEKVNEGSPSSYDPLPLQREAAPAKPYPFDALGPIAGAAARRIHEVVQAPDATCGQSVLAALSLACQGFIDVQIEGRTYPTSLFMLTISESGERKSAVDKVALKPISDWQRMLVEQYKKQFLEYKNKSDIWKFNRGKAIKSAAEGECDLATLESDFRPGDSLKPKSLALEAHAKSRWIEFHDNTDRKMTEDGEYYPIKPFASKAAEQVLRISALFAFTESLLERGGEIKINLQHVNRAITLIEYYLAEALRILGKSSGDPFINLAILTLDWIKRNRFNQTFPLADIYQRGPSQIRNATTAKKVMRILTEPS